MQSLFPLFPYIKTLRINDCYTYQGFTIDTGVDNDSFKHIIITGKNGSGKTTILNRIALVLNGIRAGNLPNQTIRSEKNSIKPSSSSNKQNSPKKQLNDVELIFNSDYYQRLATIRTEFVFSFFDVNRSAQFNDVKTVTTRTNLKLSLGNSDSASFIKKFKQYLVNKKVYEAFDMIELQTERVNENKRFFDDFTQILRRIFHDEKLELEFKKETFEFFLKQGDGRKITFNQLSDGFSAFLSILIDLLMRTDLIRQQKHDFSYNPNGFVLIDEPETHCHLAMQYEILPFIASLFPNIQLIIATHSPAVISSLGNSVVYDLSNQQLITDEQRLGSSYSELMIQHFGLENEFSPIADKIINEVQDAVLENNIEKLKQIIIENDKYLTPSLRLEIESRIIEIQSKKS
ncbi:MAG: ATP-binding protein [Planctomycetaceae bacterium]|jgi:predicted ATP-binding protein involved in virulence|nr:ATP-binding protein [Planctomycetaceae bacterium]